jgi:hypothetical protein
MIDNRALIAYLEGMNSYRIGGQDLSAAQLEALANGLRRQAREHGHMFGDRKVFLSTIPGIDLEDAACRSWLDDLRRTSRVRFARADLVAAMPAELVAASEWNLDGATLHFLVLD